MRPLLYLFALLLLGAGCKRSPAPQPEPPLAIETAVVREDSLYTRRTFITRIESNYESLIEPRVTGYLASSHYKTGLPVCRGQLLFRIEPGSYRTAVLVAEAALESSRALAVEARNNYERAVPLSRINAISGTQLDQYTAQYEASQASVESAEQTLRNARMELGYTEIYSPINGIISSSDAHVGDLVGPGTQFQTLTTIQNMDSVKVLLALPMVEFLQLYGERRPLFDNAQLLSDIVLYESDGTRYPLSGWYDYTRTEVSSTGGTLALVVRFQNPDYTLKAGQFARVECNLGERLPRVLIPQQAVMQMQGLEAVWVIRPDSTAEYRRIRTGELFGEEWAIEEGLSAGERVATTGLQKLKSGARVTLPKNS